MASYLEIPQVQSVIDYNTERFTQTYGINGGVIFKALCKNAFGIEPGEDHITENGITSWWRDERNPQNIKLDPRDNELGEIVFLNGDGVWTSITEMLFIEDLTTAVNEVHDQIDGAPSVSYGEVRSHIMNPVVLAINILEKGNWQEYLELRDS